jgi:hypothetical protein
LEDEEDSKITNGVYGVGEGEGEGVKVVWDSDAEGIGLISGVD